jgi:dihydrofolate synthase/folylpolyglutamate synthase
MEHQDFLGNRLLDIAKEKAGIIKKGVDVVTAATQPSVIRALETIAGDRGAPLWRVGKEIRYRTTASGFHYRGLGLSMRGLRLGLTGMLQARNAALALGIIERLGEKGITVSAADIREGLQKTAWPGRMQVVEKNPTILLDGAHNPAALRALARSIRAGFRYRKLVLVIGVMVDKAIGEMMRAIVPLADYLICTRPLYSRAAEPEILMAKALPFGKPGEIAYFLTDALTKAKEMADPRDLIVVCGSLFTVGEALTYFDLETYG